MKDKTQSPQREILNPQPATRCPQRWAVVVAGGAGLRMGTDTPKQFLELCGKPVLMYAIEAFADACEDIRTVVVLPPSHIEHWRELCLQHGFTLPHTTAGGGATRFQSVKNGLEMVSGDGLVAVHDGVRPLVSRQTIVNAYAEAARHGCAVPVIPIIDSVREISGKTSRALHRSALRLVQTPQVFDVTLLKRAYGQPYSAAFTDDASVYESAGYFIHLTDGNAENIKITSPHDLRVAESLKRK